MKEDCMKALRVIGFSSVMLLALAAQGGCEKKEEGSAKKEAQNITQHPAHPSKVKVSQAPESTQAPQSGVAPVPAKEAAIREVTGAAVDYDELHTLFCKQNNSENLTQREAARLSSLEDMDETYKDDAHLKMYKRAHDPDHCN
jgi:hypothetical protein